MAEPRTAPYGSWASPITSDLIVASSIGLGGVSIDGSDVYWVESRPQEQGRSVIVRCSQDGQQTDVTPPVPQSGQAAFNVRSRVHEYGGGAYLVSGGIIYFCNDADQRLYCQEGIAQPVSITEAPAQPRGLRYADGVMDAVRGRMIWVCEDHQTGSDQPINKLSTSPWMGRGRSARWSPATISMLLRGLARTIRGSLGSNGVTLTCRGTAPSCGSAIAPPMAQLPRRKS